MATNQLLTLRPGEDAVWSPASLGSSLKGWWKADAGVRARTAAQFTAANSESLSRADEAAIKCGDIDFYWAGWVMLDTTSATNRVIFTKGDSGIGAAVNYVLYKSATEVPTFVVGDNSTFKTATWGSALSTATWYFIEVYHDSVNDLIGICVNRGTDVTTATAGIIPFTASTGALKFGIGASGTLPLDGREGNWCGFKRLPSAAERNAIYNSGSGVRYADAAVSYTSLIGWWEFDENSGTRADKGPNALTLTDNNTVTANDGKVDYAATSADDAVMTWLDQSASGVNPTQATWAARPLLKLSEINGKPSFKFDGVNDVLQFTTGLIGTQPFTVWMVGKHDAANRYTMDSGVATHSGWLLEGGGVFNINAGATKAGSGNTSGAYHLFSADFNGASSKLYVDGTQNGTTGNAGTNNMTGLTVGNNSTFDAGFWFGKNVAEIIVTPILTGSDLTNMKSYLASRYGLTVA